MSFNHKKNYMPEYNCGKQSFVAKHVTRHKEEYDKLNVGVALHELAFRLVSAGTNSCGTRAMAVMGGLNPTNRFWFLVTLLYGSHRWGNPEGTKGKQLITHFTGPMYDSWKPLLDKLGVGPVASFHNSYGHKEIHLIPILLDRHLYEKIEPMVEQAYPLFLPEFYEWVVRTGASDYGMGDALESYPFGSLTATREKAMEYHSGFDGNSPENDFPVVSVPDRTSFDETIFPEVFQVE